MRYGGTNMPRKPRLYLAGVPCQVIQRGNNREAGFFPEANRVNHPSEYPWSSHPYNGAGDADNRITEHDVYVRLGRSRSTEGVSVSNVIQYGPRSEGDSRHANHRELFDAAGKQSLQRANRSGVGSTDWTGKALQATALSTGLKVDANDAHLSPTLLTFLPSYPFTAIAIGHIPSSLSCCLSMVTVILHRTIML
jgi:hypothetical protein